jgi:hypothetical protein
VNTSSVERSRVLLVAVALGLSLVAGSTPRVVGDGGEYLALALNFTTFHGPGLRVGELPRLQQELGEISPRLARWDIDASSIAGSNRRRDFVHFWVYPLLASPLVLVTKAIGVSPLWAFTALNFGLLLIAFRLALPRLGWAATLLLFGSPIIWWIDKPHTECFTFALLLIAFLLVLEKPWWAIVATSLASTQNPPIAVLTALTIVATLARNRAIVNDGRFDAGLVCGVILAVLHPVYSYVQHHTPSLLLGATRQGAPGFREISAVVLDPEIGLLANFPLLLIAIAVAAVLLLRRSAREFRAPDMRLALAAGVLFLLSFSGTANLHHGATPSLSRYGLWLIPLAAPLFRHVAAPGGAGWRRFVATTAVVSGSVCLFAFHPAVSEGGREPTWASSVLWTRHPSWNNPLAETFIETLLRREVPIAPVSTPGCEKVLLAGGSDGIWPMPCYPAPVPDFCRGPGDVCYANLVDGRYDFVRVPRTPPLQVRTDWVWPPEAEAGVRRVYHQWDWWNVRHALGPSTFVQSSRDVEVSALEGDGHFVVAFQNPGSGALVVLRPNGPVAGAFVDPVSGESVQGARFGGAPGEDWEIELPADHRVLILWLEAVPPA